MKGGSKVGRANSRTRTGCAGIRFEWMQRTCGPMLRVVATWSGHRTAYSVERNGLEAALDKAIAQRISDGAPMPDRDDLLKRLRDEYTTGTISNSLDRARNHARLAGEPARVS